MKRGFFILPIRYYGGRKLFAPFPTTRLPAKSRVVENNFHFRGGISPKARAVSEFGGIGTTTQVAINFLWGTNIFITSLLRGASAERAGSLYIARSFCSRTHRCALPSVTTLIFLDSTFLILPFRQSRRWNNTGDSRVEIWRFE